MNVISDTAQRLLHQELSEREGQIAVWHVFNLSHQMHFENNDQNEGRLQLVSDRLSPPSLSAHAGVHAPSPTHPECHRVHTPATPEGSGVRAPTPPRCIIPDTHQVHPHMCTPRSQCTKNRHHTCERQSIWVVSSCVHTNNSACHCDSIHMRNVAKAGVSCAGARGVDWG